MHNVFAHLYAMCFSHELHGMCEGPSTSKWRVPCNMCRWVSSKEKRKNSTIFNVFFSLYSYYSDRGSCVKCYLSCDTCSGPRRDQCVRCPNGWKLAAGECHPECPEGFFKTEFGCQKCHHYCKTCNGKRKLLFFWICTKMMSHAIFVQNPDKIFYSYHISFHFEQRQDHYHAHHVQRIIC